MSKEMKMLISEAFKKFKAKQKNVQWSVSAFNEKGELVVSLWHQFFEPSTHDGKKAMKYVDKVSRWSGNGNNEFRDNFDQASKGNVVVRAIIAKTSSPDAIARGEDASKHNNTFTPKIDWVGSITKWDSDNFEIVFTQE
jgi:uncharacterized membrane protein